VATAVDPAGGATAHAIFLHPGRPAAEPAEPRDQTDPTDSTGPTHPGDDADDADDASDTDDAVRLARLVAPFGASTHALADGTIVALVPGDAAVAADCALAFARAFVGAPIVLAGPDELGATPLAAVIDAGADALELADLQQIFGGALSPPGSIRTDPITARRLADRFDLHDDGAGTWCLIGRRP
jgi:hypothetical protein